ncbi:hypothetical protein DTO96_102521 [Ephemeroptericola cinctiostellae]|uniref:Uncharacterized protein n=1 Tax=Ephemeroptericola cinctiostellae TaxID=2268024 RepID=A0A345DEH7_9BURK|nr:hypothetical protein [Ephemeroptericola cinctiostellae]AXF86765.1 hypothetical protein DTO96_102521 [Ephemeroptericola cinctiostellae]
MQVVTAVITELRKRMSQALPHRIVSDDYVPFAERVASELKQGVICFVLPEVTMVDDWAVRAQPTIVGQIEVPTRDGKPSTGERAEQRLAGEIRAFLRNAGPNMPRIDVKSVKYSAQQEHPNHWCMFECEIGPISEGQLLFALDGRAAGDAPTDLYPAPSNARPLAGVSLNIDVAPHAPSTEHDQWLDDNYTTSQPDILTTVEFTND